LEANKETNMSEFILDDGRKAEKVENNPDSLTKVTEVYVEPKPSKKLSQRITERFCVCEREVETVDEETGEVVDRVVENLCGQAQVRAVSGEGHSVLKAVEKRMSEKASRGILFFGAIVAVQLAALVYVLFFM
jgi:hypothetical protein